MQPFLELDKKGLPKLSDDQVRNSVTDLPLVSSRAGTYIWINACLFARPLTDDMTLMQLLHARGADNIQASAVDLLVASFEILTNALLIKESDQSVDLIKSFICNRLPPLLASVSNLLLPLTSEQCIQMGFSNINIDPLPPLTDGADVIREQLQVTRSEFLQACILHALVSDTTVAVILQRPSTALPKAQKLNKDMLVQQCAHNTGKVEGLIESLKAMQGNAGAIAGCIVDIVNNCCNLKDTMSLKAVCMSLIKHIPSIDVIFQYNQPMHLILPMCSLLNDWVHEQDQSELQPPYEEFAVIFLLVLVVINRYNLRKEDIGILDNENFILTMMRDQSTSSALESMPDVQKERLAKWIEGLYATDEQDETSGINDEVMSQCPPQAFYQLVPTLFEQSVIARKSNAVPVATLLGGLELLLEPFLLPSLIGGLSWMIKHSWEDHGDADILLAMLNKLLKPSSPSSDTQAMHKAILGIIATPLAQSLETLKRKSFKKDVNGLLEILRPHLNQQRSTQASSTEVQQWAVAFEEDYAKAISTNVRHVVKWITAVGPNPPPSFSFRLYVTLIELIGPEAVLDAMLDEIAQLTVAGKGAEALDVCAAIVCAPSPDRATGSALQRVLHLRSLDTEGLLDAPASRSEATLRLQRRVDAHHTAMLTASTSMTMPMQDQAADQMMQDLGLTGDDSGVGNASASQSGVQAGDEGLNFDGTDISSQLNQPMDGINNANNDATGLEATGSAGQVDQMQDIFGDLGVDLGNSGGDQGIDAFNPQGDGGMGQQSQEDDIFAGLDMDLADFTDDYNFG
ncbi:Med5-domain-containing protein [Polychaeton citri CBS 116435]|uniref:Mediator of RNA polymerase II transcription subunit 5 n=1 Tax=Polychaeton citri CBS 116435 TaxID=1314669 RepID=A0A9P4Q750_9PEZI|nr:Med5-domain-containing protein [Polychaeton citri CBS 116435]